MWISFYIIICHLYIISGESFSNLLTPSLFKLGHFFPHCWVLESYSHTPATSPWLAMYSASIFPQSIASLFIFLSVFQRKEGFNCDEVQLIVCFSFFYLCFCVISQKSLTNPRSQRYFLCFVLEHLLFYTEHSGLWYILSSSLYMVQGIVKVLFFFFFWHINVQLFQHHFSTPWLHLLHWLSMNSLFHLYYIFQKLCFILALAKNWVLNVSNKILKWLRKDAREGGKEIKSKTDKLNWKSLGCWPWLASWLRGPPTSQPRKCLSLGSQLGKA